MTDVNFEGLFLRVLSNTEWKKAIQIEREMAELANKEGLPLEVETLAPKCYLALIRGEYERWVESRTREVPKSLGNPTGKRHEYRKVGAGKRMKAPQSNKSVVDFGGLVPSPA